MNMKIYCSQKNIKKQIYFKIIVNYSFNKWNFYVVLTFNIEKYIDIIMIKKL